MTSLQCFFFFPLNFGYSWASLEIPSTVRAHLVTVRNPLWERFFSFLCEENRWFASPTPAGWQAGNALKSVFLRYRGKHKSNGERSDSVFLFVEENLGFPLCFSWLTKLGWSISLKKSDILFLEETIAKLDLNLYPIAGERMPSTWQACSACGLPIEALHSLWTSDTENWNPMELPSLETLGNRGE